MHSRFVRTSLALCVAVSACSAAIAAPKYRMRDVGSFAPGMNTFASAIADDGAVTGMAWANSPTMRGLAFLYDGHGLQSIGELASFGSAGNAISADHRIVGWSSVAQGTGQGPAHAFLYDKQHGMRDLGPFKGFETSAEGVNSSGQVTGTYLTDIDDPKLRSFLYHDGAMHDIGTLGGDETSATAINEKGHVTGYSTLAGTGEVHAFLYTANGMQDIDGPGTGSMGRAINDLDQVTGYSFVPGGTHAFIYANGAMKDIGTLGTGHSDGRGINNAGHVVGESSTGHGYQVHAFYFDGGQMHDLNDLADTQGWELTNAVDINNAGQILAWGYDAKTYRYHSFVLTPVPEPATWAAMAAGLMLLAAWRTPLSSRKRGQPHGAGSPALPA